MCFWIEQDDSPQTGQLVGVQPHVMEFAHQLGHYPVKHVAQADLVGLLLVDEQTPANGQLLGGTVLVVDGLGGLEGNVGDDQLVPVGLQQGDLVVDEEVGEARHTLGPVKQLFDLHLGGPLQGQLVDSLAKSLGPERWRAEIVVVVWLVVVVCE